MPRIIVLSLTAAALAALALQNLATEVPLVILGRTFVEAMPLGLLLVITVGIGALLTLVFYGLVGSRRPPESKYRPMGRRVPYPDAPSSSPLPPSGYGNDSSMGGQSKSYGGSSAFVSEPSANKPVKEPNVKEPDVSKPNPSEQPFVSPPEDQPLQDTPPSESATPPSDPSSSVRDNFAAPSSNYFNPSREPDSTDAASAGNTQGSFREQPYREPSYRDDSYAESSYQTPPYGETPYSESSYTESSYTESSYSSTADSDLTDRDLAGNNSARTASAAASSFVQQPIAGLKSVFSKKKERKDEAGTPKKGAKEEENRPIGDDWGQRRTKAQINDWDVNVGEPSKLEEGAKNLFNFGRNVSANAGKLAEDIASGWNNQPPRNAPQNQQAQQESLDQGWDAFDDYADPPPQVERQGEYQGERFEKRTYGDSLYGNDDRLDDGYADGQYVDESSYADEPYVDEIGPDGVYDADYKVIVPPSKPLADDDDR